MEKRKDLLQRIHELDEKMEKTLFNTIYICNMLNIIDKSVMQDENIAMHNMINLIIEKTNSIIEEDFVDLKEELKQLTLEAVVVEAHLETERINKEREKEAKKAARKPRATRKSTSSEEEVKKPRGRKPANKKEEPAKKRVVKKAEPAKEEVKAETKEENATE